MPGRPLLRWQRIHHAVWCGLVGERRCGQLHAVRGWLLGSSAERLVHGVCGRYILGSWQRQRRRLHGVAHVRGGPRSEDSGHIRDGSHMRAVCGRLDVVWWQRWRCLRASDALYLGRVGICCTHGVHGPRLLDAHGCVSFGSIHVRGAYGHELSLIHI